MADKNSITEMSIDEYFQTTAIGSVDRAIANNLYGINHTQNSGFIPMNKDERGFVFVVRPQLNLQSDNIRNRRELYPMLNDRDDSIARYTRMMLDPRLAFGYTPPAANSKSRLTDIKYATDKPMSCPFVDPYTAFIPAVTNNVTAASGFPDLVLPLWSSEKGLYNEGYFMVDGVYRNYEEYDIDLTFRNTRGDPLMYQFYTWQLYSSMVFEGLLMPYIDFITEREIDYSTRIYRLVMDETKTYVTKIMCTGASMPVSLPIGSMFDFNLDEVYNKQNSTFTVRFKSVGAVYFDPIVARWFNETVVIFNLAMADAYRSQYMTKITKSTMFIFNNRCYPRINPETYELEWWVPNDVFKTRSAAFLKQSAK